MSELRIILVMIGIGCQLFFLNPLRAQTELGRTDVWMQQFPSYIHGSAYSLKNWTVEKSRDSAGNILISLAIPRQPCRKQLAWFSSAEKFAEGLEVVFESTDKEKKSPKSDVDERCDRQVKAAIKKRGVIWPTCEASDRDTEVRYLLPQTSRPPVCIYRISTTSSTPDLRARRDEPLEVGFVSPVKEGIFDSLAEVFRTAPWPKAMTDAGFRPCNDYSSPVGGYVRQEKKSNHPESQLNLSHPSLRWAYYYFVRVDHGYECAGGIRYRVDPVTTLLAYLPDNTALLKGNRSVLRIRMEDGGTPAAEHVKQVVAERFFIDLKADGGDDCVAPTVPYGDERCKWLVTQGWYPYLKIQAKNPKWDPEHDSTYARNWFQGFDRAIDRVYFSNRK